LKKIISILLIKFILIFNVAFATARWPVDAEHGMVVTAHHLATKVGVDILKQGGNAIDAAIATAYALAVVYPVAGNLGGGGFMTLRLANGEISFLDFREKAPLNASPTMFLDSSGQGFKSSTEGHLAVGVPGTVAGLEMARTRFASMKRAVLMKPAIRLAKKGFVLDAGDVSMLSIAGEDFRRNEDLKRIFLHQGKPFKEGELLVQTDLSRTLEKIKRNGESGFYTGFTANELVSSSKKGGGIIIQEDLRQYRARELSPIECDYRGYHLISAPPPSSGGVILCEMLNVLEGGFNEQVQRVRRGAV